MLNATKIGAAEKGRYIVYADDNSWMIRMFDTRSNTELPAVYEGSPVYDLDESEVGVAWICVGTERRWLLEEM